MTATEIIVSLDKKIADLKRRLAEAEHYRDFWRRRLSEAADEYDEVQRQLAATQARVERLEGAIRDAKGLVEGDENDLTMAYNVLDEALNAESEAT